jgi:hypothetical protein
MIIRSNKNLNFIAKTKPNEYAAKRGEQFHDSVLYIIC